MRLGFVTDIHWNRDPDAAAGWHHEHDFAGVGERLPRAFELFAERRVDLVAIGGDLAHGGDEGSLAAVLELAAGCGLPAVLVAGNHDVSHDPDALVGAIAAAGTGGPTLLGGEGVECEGVRVAGVHVGETDGWFGARLRDPLCRAAWPPGAAVLISHFPALSRAQFLSDRAFPYPGDLLDRGELAAELLGREEPTIVLSGHIHARDTWSEGAVLQFSQGALIEAPFECGLIEIGADADGSPWARRESVRLAPSREPREPVFSPELEAWSFDGGRWRERTAAEATPENGHPLAAERQEPNTDTRKGRHEPQR